MSEIAHRNLPASARSKRAMLRSKASGTAIAVSEHAQEHATPFRVAVLDKLLVIEPHPDDYILMCGGLARKLVDNGKEVHVVTFTNSGSTFQDKEKHRLERSEESKRADRILGTTSREILGFEVRESWDNPSKLYNELMRKIREIQPDTIVTMHYDNMHPDHMWIATFIKPLIYQAGEKIRPDWGEPVKARLLLGENPRSQLTNPNVYVDITNTFEAKEYALREQKSQFDLETDLVENLTVLKDLEHRLHEAAIEEGERLLHTVQESPQNL